MSPLACLRPRRYLVVGGVFLAICSALYLSCANLQADGTHPWIQASQEPNTMLAQGKSTFRYETFGSEDCWGGQLRLHDAIQGSKLGGTGAGVSPNQALKLGLTGVFNADGKTLKSVGIQCALCHSAVDDSFAPGIGRRLDGWPNRDLNEGAIIASAPNLKPLADMLQVDEPTVKKVLTSWGPGKFDAQLNLDGKAFRPDGKPAATLNPAAFGLAAR